MNALTSLWAADPSLKFNAARERIKNAYAAHGKGLILSTSFGAQAAILLHLANEVVPGLPVVFVDTGYLFPQTYQYAKLLEEKLNLNLFTYKSNRTAAMQEALEGKRWQGSEEQRAAYNWENKVEPMSRAVVELGATAWISGLRREQSERRGNLDFEEQQRTILKLYPILDWNNRDIFYYRKDNDIPPHPLAEEGYDSIGDWHSTFKGVQRAECGLHDESAAPRPEGLNYVI